MPCRNANPLLHAQIGVVRMSGRFRPNGSSAIDASLKKGIGYTPSYVTTGKYLITLDEVGSELIACGAHLMQANAGVGDQEIRVGTYDASAKTLTLFNWDISGTGAADLASDADTWICWWMEFQNTTKAVG